MSKNCSFQRDCTEQCKSLIHGNLVNSAFSIFGVSGIHLCSYLNYICTNCDLVKDIIGRTALHSAASYGYLEVVRWLLNNKNANINARDDESGYTALHRALYYGRVHIAVELLKAGADTTLLDRDGLTAFEHIILDGYKPRCSFGSVYTWGLNKNNSLGSFSSRNIPESLDSFHKKYPKEFVQQICIDTFHSIIITTNGHAYSCGHGLGGRLGQGNENTVVEHKEITFPEKVFVIQISIARDHSLFLTTAREIYSCGDNTHKVLGLSPPPSGCLSPEKVKCLQSKIISGISTSRYHSVAWTSLKLYAWGLNGGQLGLDGHLGNYVVIPKGVYTLNTKQIDVKKVALSDGATAVLTGTGDVYALHNFQCRRIASRLLNLVDLAIIGGKLKFHSGEEIKTDGPKELKVVILTSTGLLYFWRESDQELCRLNFSIHRDLSVINVSLNYNQILVATKYGECFSAVIKERDEKLSWNRRNLSSLPVVSVTISKIHKIYRASSIVSDPKGENFGVIQENPYIAELPEKNIMKSELENDLAKFLEESTEEDNIHEVLIKIENRKFAVHKYILANESNLLTLCNNENEIVLDNVNADFFQELLQYIYTGTCSLLEVGECPKRFIKYCLESDGVTQEISKGKKTKTPQNPIRMLQEISKRFGCKKLHHILRDFYMQSVYIFRNGDIDTTLKLFQRTAFPEYYDISLKCSDNKEIKAHKCILIARLDYFNSLFAARWTNDSRISIDIPHTSNLVEALLDFLYTDSYEFLLDKDGEFLLKLLFLADEYLVDQLKSCCAYLILKQNYLNLKNAIEVLQIAYQVKSTFLIEGVMTYIVRNLLHFLENKVLHDLPDDLLIDLAMYYIRYRKLDRRYCSYTISPDLTDEIIKIHEKYPVNLEIIEKRKLVTVQKNPKRRSKVSRKSTNEKSLQKDSDEEDREDHIEHRHNSADETTEKENIDRSVQERVSAICSAARLIETTIDEPSYTNLRNLSLSDSLNDFPSLSSPSEGIHHRLSSSPNYGKSFKKHKIVRMSQKERMRLSSESKESTPAVPETSKNPWKKIPDLPVNLATSPTNSTFCDILLDERKLKENFVKVTNKQLVHTQIEDRAIMELEKFYNIREVEDEVITVERVNIGNIASPVWVPGNHPRNSFN